MWQTEEVRDHAVSPLDEVRSGLAVFEQTLWQALAAPPSAGSIARSASRWRSTPRRCASDPRSAAIATAIPNVTPEVTRKAAWMARWTAADLYRARSMRSVRSCRSPPPPMSC